jgi:LAO/AO transport system kinase
MANDHEALIARMLAGERAALAKLITLVESRGPEFASIMSRLHGHYGGAFVLGITGPPGAGKSTLLDRLVGAFRAGQHQVGIIAVDPSSPFSGGALLGDRIRMQGHFLDEGVFIRSLSARGSVGGLAGAARDVIRLLDAFGKDVIIVETVGVGQNEFDVMRVAHTVIVVLVPEAGDTIQTMKAGLLEIADIFVVNKSDREGGARIKSELEMMLHLRPPGAWTVPVLATVATDGQGVDALMAAIAQHREFLAHSGEGTRRVVAGRRAEFAALLRAAVQRAVERALTGALAGVRAAVERGEIDPHRAVRQVLSDERVMAVLREIAAGDGDE